MNPLLARIAAPWFRRPDIRRRRLARFRRSHPVSPEARSSPPGSLCVVMPVYGHATFLPRALESVAKQTRFPDELVLVVDASPDDSARVAEAALAAWPPERRAAARILHNPVNMGQAASINRAVAASQSELIMILNDDDLLLPHAVEAALTLFARHADVHLLGAHAGHFSSPEQARELAGRAWGGIDAARLDQRTPAQADRYRRGTDFNLTHSGSCFSRVAWAAAGGYYADARRRVIRFSDRDFQLRVASLFPAVLLPDFPLSLWRSDSSVDAGRNS